MIKVAIIGAGSTVFMKNIVTDIVLEPGLETAHIALHDIDDKRLATSEKVARRISATTGTAPAISATLDRRAALQDADLSLLVDSAELALIKAMAAWPRTVENAAESHEPHRIAYYLQDLSSAFHALWTKGAKEDTNLRFITEQDKCLTLARMALVTGLVAVIASGLEVMGVKPVEELR